MKNKYKNMKELELFFAFFSLEVCIKPLNEKSFPLRHIIGNSEFQWKIEDKIGKLSVLHEGFLIQQYCSRKDGADQALIETLEFARDKLTEIYHSSSLKRLLRGFINSFDPRLEIFTLVDSQAFEEFKDAAEQLVKQEEKAA